MEPQSGIHLFEILKKIDIPVESQFRMQSTLQEQLVTANAFHFFDLGCIFIECRDVDLLITDRAVEIAEFASRDTGIGDVNVPVDDPGDFVFRMMDLPQFIGCVNQLPQRKLMIQRKRLGGIQEFQSQGFLDKQIQVHVAGFVTVWKIKLEKGNFYYLCLLN
jgi:hypothetical protein